MVRLTQDQRNVAVQMLLRGASQAVIARNFQVSKSTITRLYQRLRQTGTTNDRPRSGRPRVTTRRQDRYIRLTHLRDRFREAAETSQVTPGTHNNRISADTVRNRLREFGLRPRRPYVGMPLTPRRRQVRMLEWRGSHNIGQTCFPFVSGVTLCFLTSPGTCCTELTAVNVCIGVTESVIVTIVWLNVIDLEAVGDRVGWHILWS